jgi:hypothetical protein
VKRIQLLESAGTRLERIGDPDAAARFRARFYRWVRLDCGARIVERHPRSFDYE